jgi:bifunctional DNA-binding transcriptional regulator/antitoxin component of YhaV-PrlF toxin-antitoxin module
MVHKIEKEGEFTIPWGYAEVLNVRENDMVEIKALNNEIIIRKLTLSCVFCSSVGKLVRIGRVPACRSCIQRLGKAEDGDYLYPI